MEVEAYKGMPVINTIKEFVDARGLTVYRFWRDTGIAQATAYRLYRNPNVLPAGSVMEAICETYDCQPGDFLLYTPGMRTKSQGKKPIQQDEAIA